MGINPGEVVRFTVFHDGVGESESAFMSLLEFMVDAESCKDYKAKVFTSTLWNVSEFLRMLECHTRKFKDVQVSLMYACGLSLIPSKAVVSNGITKFYYGAIAFKEAK